MRECSGFARTVVPRFSIRTLPVGRRLLLRKETSASRRCMLEADARRIVESSEVVLLDMCGTFMFGHDRFGPSEDYAQTYRALGGKNLSPESVQQAVTACFDTLDRIYEDVARHDSFPSVLSALRCLFETRDWPESDVLLVERVFAEHERGRVPGEYADAVRFLARSHRLALVSNIWSEKRLYVEELERVGVIDAFEVTLFSSDVSNVKPSRTLFDRAIHSLRVDRAKAVVIGDSLRRDIGGAVASGLRSVWINPAGHEPLAHEPHPDAWISNLLDIIRGK
jgi:FMN phosphatase YigB (HAD superfamily)